MSVVQCCNERIQRPMDRVHRYRATREGVLLPWGTKRIPYASIKSVRRFTMTALRGKGRIWGSGDLRHWANFDPQRPRKSIGFFVTVGGPHHPVRHPGRSRCVRAGTQVACPRGILGLRVALRPADQRAANTSSAELALRPGPGSTPSHVTIPSSMMAA